MTQNCIKISRNAEKLESITDGFVHFQLVLSLRVLPGQDVEEKRPIYDCRCDERLKAKGKRSTRLTYIGFLGGLEHPKIETRCPLFIMNR